MDLTQIVSELRAMKDGAADFILGTSVLRDRDYFVVEGTRNKRLHITAAAEIIERRHRTNTASNGGLRYVRAA